MRITLWGGLFALCAGLSPLRAENIVLDIHPGTSDRELHRALQLPSDEDVSAKTRTELNEALDRFRAGNLDDCLKRFEKLAETQPDLPLAKLMLARLLLTTGQRPQGRLLLEQAAAETAHPDVYLQFGDLALAENRFTDAELHFRRAAQLVERGKSAQSARPTTVAVLKQRRQIHGGLAAVAEGRSDWAAAEQALWAWLELEPEHGAARQRLGRALFWQERYDEAAEALRQAERDDSELEPAALSMGRFHQQAGDREQAARWMARALESAPESSRVHLTVALWNLENERADDARTHLEAAARLDPALPELARLRGLVARHRRDYEAAEGHFQTVLHESPADFGAANQLVLVLIEQFEEGKRRRALQLAEVNARQYPRSPDALATLGWVYYRLGRLDEAEQMLQAATAGGQATSETAYYLARILADRGKTDDARQLLETALKPAGPFVHRADAKQRLQALADPNAQPSAESTAR